MAFMWVSALFWLVVLVNGSPFLTTWRTTSNNESITLPLTLPVSSPINITWGDGQIVTVNTSIVAPITHTYNTSGLHNVSISGNISFGFNATGDVSKIVEITSWGDGFLVNSTSASMFENCVNLQVSVSDMTQPVFLPGATLSGMFKNSGVNTPFNWDLANVKSLASMFNDAFRMNQPVNFSNAGGVTDAFSMFSNATNFNSTVTFDSSNVTNMTNMFSDTLFFNQPVILNTDSLLRCRGMFARAWSFNQRVTLSNTSKVTDMSHMFFFANNFNQPVELDTRSVTLMASMFGNAIKFNQRVNFDTPIVTDMHHMFSNATSFNHPVNFDTRAVTKMDNMFAGATSFNQRIDFQADSLVVANQMFSNAASFNQNVILRNTDSLTTVAEMFANANPCFNKTVSLSSTANITNMSWMFSNVPGFQQNLAHWDVSAVANCSNFCPQCGLPSFISCGPPCGSVAPITNGSMPTCNLPIKVTGCPVDVCPLVQVPPSLQAECILSTSNGSPTPAPRTTPRGGTIVSPLFEITQTNESNSSTFIFTLPIDPELYDEVVGTVSQSCSGQELSCEWQNPTSLEFQQSGCAVSRERVDLGSGIVGTECTCTHLTVFALVLRNNLHLTPLCHAQDADYVLLALYAALTAVLVVQVCRVMMYKLYKTALTQHSLMLLACVLRIVYLVLKPVITSLVGLMLLGLLPSAIALTLFIHLLLMWASLQMQFSNLQASPFARFRVPFLIITALVFVLVVVLAIVVGAKPEVEIVQGGSYAFAALTAIVCLLVLVTGLGLRKSLGDLIAASPSSTSGSSAPSWREILRHRLLVATVGLGVSLLVVACLWAAAVQTDILVSSAATLATTTSFYVFDWLSLSVLAWLFSSGIKKKLDSRSSKNLTKT